jgi:hypothetical protein
MPNIDMCIELAAFMPPPDADTSSSSSESVAAVLLGHDEAEPAAVGERLVELGREFVRLVLAHPVVVVELRGQLADGGADRLLDISELKVHGRAPQVLVLPIMPEPS